MLTTTSADGTTVRAYDQRHGPTIVLLGPGLDAIQRVLPHAELVVMPKRDHGADLKAPNEVARVIETLADKVLH
jgi:pimeloyl-ACP methyl ester carboxylesterase